MLPTILSDFRVGLSSDRKPVLGIIYYRHCYLAGYPLKVEILDEVKPTLYTSVFKLPHGGFPKSSCGLICTQGLCIGFVDIGALVGNYPVNFIAVSTSLEFAPNNT